MLRKAHNIKIIPGEYLYPVELYMRTNWKTGREFLSQTDLYISFVLYLIGSYVYRQCLGYINTELGCPKGSFQKATGLC